MNLPPEEWRSKFEGLNYFTVMEYVDPVWKPWLLHARPNAFDPGIDLLDLAPTVLVKNSVVLG